jgi:hypothetical protein
MGSVRLVERVTSPFAGARVDREAGVIRGVLVCGRASLNARDYPDEVWPPAIGKYEGLPVYANHGRERRVEDKVGWVTAARVEGGQPRADIHLLKSHPLYPQVMEAAERNPSLYGFSHVADCQVGPGSRGRQKVEGIDKPVSLDLVAEPATTKGFFESKGAAVATTVREVMEGLRPRLPADRAKALRTFLLVSEEDAGLAPLMDAPMDAPMAGGDPEADRDAAFESLMTAAVRQFLADMDEGALHKNIRAAAQHLKKVKGQAAADPEPEGDDMAEESKTPDAAALVREAIDVCRKVGFRGFDADHLQAIVEAAPERREWLARQLMAGARVAESQEPTSRRRGGPPAKPTLAESIEPAESLIDGPLGWSLN